MTPNPASEPTVSEPAAIETAAGVAPVSEPPAGGGEAISPSQLPAGRPPERINHIPVHLTAIRGIGESRAYKLEEIDIDSLEKLASATPEQISQALKGVKVEQAAQFIEKAKQLLASRQPAAAPPE